VEQRHRIDPDVVGGGSDTAREEPRIVDKTAMTEQRALRKARGAGSVLNLRDIVRRYRRQIDAPGRCRDKFAPIRQRYDATQIGKPRLHVADHGKKISAAILSNCEQANGFGLIENIRQFVGLIGRVDRHERNTGQSRTEFQRDPLRAVRRPYGDMFALPEVTAQGVRNLFCIAQQIGETPALRPDGRSIDNRGSRSPLTRCMP
jgi:hypothetical protein